MPLVSPAHPTRDGWIPAAVFDVWLQNLDAAESALQLRQANAVAHGTAMAQDGKQPAVKRLTAVIHRRAFPRLYRRRTVAPPTPPTTPPDAAPPLE